MTIMKEQFDWKGLKKTLYLDQISILIFNKISYTIFFLLWAVYFLTRWKNGSGFVWTGFWFRLSHDGFIYLYSCECIFSVFHNGNDSVDLKTHFVWQDLWRLNSNHQHLKTRSLWTYTATAIDLRRSQVYIYINFCIDACNNRKRNGTFWYSC